MYHLSKLKNGITLITVPVEGTKATTVLAMFPLGSRYETKELSGASHFVEHMMFKGTVKRPKATDISRALEAVGAEYNASTNKDHTGYYVKIDSQQQEIAFDLLSDMLYHSVLEAGEMEKEKGTIVEELRMYLDNPLLAVDLLFDKVMFGDCPLGWDIGGTEGSVRAITQESLYQYYQSHYSPKNMVLVVAGAVDKKKLNRLLKYFINKTAPPQSHNLSFYKNDFVKFAWPKNSLALPDRIAIKKKDVDQAQIILGFPGLNNNHPDRFAAAVMLHILSSGMSSRLFVEVREKRGLAYLVRGGAFTFRDAGVVYIQAGLDPARLQEALSVIKSELKRLAAEPVTARELRDAKTSIAGRMALSLEDSSAQAEWYAKQFMFSAKIETPEFVLKKINGVTAAAVGKIARKIFQMDQMRLAGVGPVAKDQIIKMLV